MKTTINNIKGNQYNLNGNKKVKIDDSKGKGIIKILNNFFKDFRILIKGIFKGNKDNKLEL